MKSFRDVLQIVSRIRYKNWNFYLGRMGDGYYLQLQWHDADHDNPGATVHLHGRKWYLSPHMTESEIVLTAWAAVEFAELHEARELFTYDYKRILNPHVHVRNLMLVCGQEDVRHPA